MDNQVDVPILDVGGDYRIWTTAHDRVLHGSALIESDDERDALRHVFTRHVAIDRSRPTPEAMIRGKARGEALMALEALETALDASPAPKHPITILLDCSGSMRGMPIRTMAGMMDAVAEILMKRDIPFELLGHTTGHWKGGPVRTDFLAENARRLEKGLNRIRMPGRMNDLLHIVLKAHHEDWRQEALLPLLLPYLPKENIDGEALLWARERALQNDAGHPRILHLSDGAPVDCATLMLHPSSYLADHLEAVRIAIGAEGAVRLVEADLLERHPEERSTWNDEEMQARLCWQLVGGVARALDREVERPDAGTIERSATVIAGVHATTDPDHLLVSTWLDHERSGTLPANAFPAGAAVLAPASERIRVEGAIGRNIDAIADIARPVHPEIRISGNPEPEAQASFFRALRHQEKPGRDEAEPAAP